MTLCAFLHGLTQTCLREHICLTSPRSLSAVLEAAELAKAVLHDGDAPSRSNQHVRYVAAFDSGERTCRVQGGPQRQVQEHANYREWSSKRAERVQGFPRRRRQPQQMGTDFCFRCEGPGHIARHCPAPAPLDTIRQQLPMDTVP